MYNWRHLSRSTDTPEAWIACRADNEEAICAFFRCPLHDHAWVIMGTGRDGAHFTIVSVNQLIWDVRKEAELALYDFGWTSA